MPFAPGQSGNPTGRPKIKLADGRTLTDFARGHTELAVRTLVAVAKSGESDAAKVAAANSLLDRGWGKPAQSVTLAGDRDNPVVVANFDKLSTTTLREIASLSLTSAET